MILELLQKPFIQVLVFLLLTIISISIIGPKNTENTWNVAGIIFIVFMIVNAIVICFAAHHWTYFFYSLGCSVLYLISIAVIIPIMTKLLKIEGAGESAMIFIYIIYHPVFLLFMLFLKWVYVKVF